MLMDQEQFRMMEQLLIENGTIKRFEKENGPVRGRMMIDRRRQALILNVSSGSRSMYRKSHSIK